MLFRTLNNKYKYINRLDYKTDKEYNQALYLFILTNIVERK